MTDAMWLIDRGDNSPNASITGRGRDILDFQYAVTIGQCVQPVGVQRRNVPHFKGF